MFGGAIGIEELGRCRLRGWRQNRSEGMVGGRTCRPLAISRGSFGVEEGCRLLLWLLLLLLLNRRRPLARGLRCCPSIAGIKEFRFCRFLVLITLSRRFDSFNTLCHGSWPPSIPSFKVFLWVGRPIGSGMCALNPALPTTGARCDSGQVRSCRRSRRPIVLVLCPPGI